MKNQILKLEKIARQLEPSARQRKKVRRRVIRYAESFLNKIEKAKAFEAESDRGTGLLKFPVPEKPIGIKKAIRLIRDNVDFPSLNPASGGHFGYIPGGGIYYASLGDYLADISNRYAAIFFAGPGAVRMENLLIRWIAGILGYPTSASGNHTSGGSLANLAAICTARDAKKITSSNMKKSVVYLSAQAHHSVDKALRIAGMNECILRYVKLDDQYRIDPVALEKQIAADRKKKLNPFMIIAAAGTTDVGAIDPLEKLGGIAKRNKLWYHIDAAYGGFFILTKEGKRKLKGIEMSDSLAIDPHKGLFLPYGSGVVLVRNGKLLGATHYYHANYMQDARSSTEEPSPSNYSAELTKHFRGLRMWLPLQLLGLKPFTACLEEKLLLAKYFYREVKKIGFEVGKEPQLSVVTYRYVPRQGNADEFNKKIQEAILKDGRVFISSTLLDGKFTLRFACLSFRTHLSNVNLLLKLLKKTVLH